MQVQGFFFRLVFVRRKRGFNESSRGEEEEDNNEEEDEGDD